MSKLNELLQYARDCICGQVNCCEKHKWACTRFLLDYDDAQEKNSKFIFDWAKVEHVIRWSALFKHTKGVLANKPINLHISQIFVVANIYGFYYRSTGYRRFQKFYFQVARKNAKSQLLAVLLSYELMVFLKGGVSEVYCAATKKDQALIVYNELKLMLNKCGPLKGKWREAYRQIEHLKSGSVCRALSKEDRKSGDGLNPQCVCIDEYHAHETTEMYDVMDSGDGARPESLLGIITTAGFELNHPCYNVEYKLVTRILDPYDETDLENYFCDIHELETNNTSEDITLEDGSKIEPGGLLDDPFDEANWPKANPVVCSYAEGVEKLRKKSKEAQAAPDKMRNYLTKHMNVWVDQREAGYMKLATWNACRVDELPETRGLICYVGLDLSAKGDLTSADLEIVFPDGRYGIIGKSFMPEAKFAEKMKTDKARYDLWEKQGWLEVTLGPVVDYRRVVQWCRDTASDLGLHIEEWCVDPWGSVQISNDLIESGETVVDITQGIKTLSEPTKDFRDQCKLKNIIHLGSPIIAWAIGNAVVDSVDRNENILLNKKKSTERIDPIACVMNSHVRAMAADGGQSYNTQEMRGFE